MDHTLEFEILLTRLEARGLADVLPACRERLEIYNTILACDLMLKNLRSGKATDERVNEMRQAYEGWKRSKRRSLPASLHRKNHNESGVPRFN